MAVKALVANVNAERGNANLSSAIRLFVLQHYEDQISAHKRERQRHK
jgi:predicted DNA-binding ribbon-helix-helix protein